MMKLKASFKASDCKAKVRADANVKLSDSQKGEYENRISKLKLERDNAYMAGLNQGKEEGYSNFWDAYQNYGKLTNYSKAFSGHGWNDDSFKPKYNIRVVEMATNMFSSCKITDLKKALENAKVKLNVSNTTRTDYMFYRSEVTVVPQLDIRRSTNLMNMFYDASSLHTVEGLTIADDGSQDFTGNVFYRCRSLKNITFDGLIGSDLDMSDCPLSKESIENIVICLSTNVNDKTLKLSKAAVNKAFETDDEANNGTQSEVWKDLYRMRPMWNFELV